MKTILYLFLLLLPFQLLAQSLTTSSGYTTVARPTMDSLTSGSVSAANTMDINFSMFIPSYTYIYIIWSIKPTTDNTNLEMLVSPNGSAYDNSAGNYAYYLFFGSSSTTSSSAAFISLGTSYGGGTGEHSDGTTIIQNPNTSTNKPLIFGQIAEIPTGSGSTFPGMITFSAVRQTTQVTKAIRLFMSSGTITGTYKVFGMKN